jgi:putative pyruvate formate lyase activating enzyme
MDGIVGIMFTTSSGLCKHNEKARISMAFPNALLYNDHLADCTLCPRACHANRHSSHRGYCGAGDGMEISSICIHRGEEPVISGNRGICNIFFAHCNLRCVFCQNHQISQPSQHQPVSLLIQDLDQATQEIVTILQTGINMVGFVSPSHMIPQMLRIQESVQKKGFLPTWVYNSNGYDSVAVLKELEGHVDVYLPDMKYMDPFLAKTYSDAPDYPDVAMASLKEMVRQKGTNLIVNESGYATSGILVRHLVLPGGIKNSLEVLRFLAHELSPRIHVALMSQYYPTYKAEGYPPIDRVLTAAEYQEVVEEMDRLGMDRGFIQNMESFNHYQPDFSQNHPFENE